MKYIPLLENQFYHDGRGPELQETIWSDRGIILHGFEYFNPDDAYEIENLRHLQLIGVQVYSMAYEEVHAEAIPSSNLNAGVFEILNSKWLKSFNPDHLSNCRHFQVVFYDEIYNIICEKIVAGNGKLIS